MAGTTIANKVIFYVLMAYVGLVYMVMAKQAGPTRAHVVGTVEAHNSYYNTVVIIMSLLITVMLL